MQSMPLASSVMLHVVCDAVTGSCDTANALAAITGSSVARVACARNAAKSRQKSAHTTSAQIMKLCYRRR